MTRRRWAGSPSCSGCRPAERVCKPVRQGLVDARYRAGLRAPRWPRRERAATEEKAELRRPNFDIEGASRFGRGVQPKLLDERAKDAIDRGSLTAERSR